MSHEHTVTLAWKRSGPDFLKGKYSREHTWRFDGGLSVPASPAPANVPAPWSNPAHVDPEEAFIAAIASCHLLTFLWLASRAGFQADSYEDTPIGVVAKNEHGAMWVSLVTLRPRIVWSGERLPTGAEVEALHHRAHEQCIIANSVRTKVVVEPVSG